MSLVITLIEKAAKNLGSQAALARELGVHRAQITNWKNGNDKCQPADLAAIGYFAGYNALNILAAATLKETEGTAKGKVLEAALGKEIPGLLCLNASGSTTQNDGNSREIQCILCKVDQTHVARASKKLKALTERKQRSSLTD